MQHPLGKEGKSLKICPTRTPQSDHLWTSRFWVFLSRVQASSQKDFFFLNPAASSSTSVLWKHKKQAAVPANCTTCRAKRLAKRCKRPPVVLEPDYGFFFPSFLCILSNPFSPPKNMHFMQTFSKILLADNRLIYCYIDLKGAGLKPLYR